MPEIKEVTSDASQSNMNEEVDLLAAKEKKPAEASSGTLPADETEVSAEGNEGEVAPDFGQGETLEEGKNITENIATSDDKLEQVASVKEEEKNESNESGNASLSEGNAAAEGNPCDEDSPEVKFEESNEESAKQEASPVECESEEFKQASPEESKTEEAMEVVVNRIQEELLPEKIEEHIEESKKEEPMEVIIDRIQEELPPEKIEEHIGGSKTEEAMEVIIDRIQEELPSENIVEHMQVENDESQKVECDKSEENGESNKPKPEEESTLKTEEMIVHSIEESTTKRSEESTSEITNTLKQDSSSNIELNRPVILDINNDVEKTEISSRVENECTSKDTNLTKEAKVEDMKVNDEVQQKERNIKTEESNKISSNQSEDMKVEENKEVNMSEKTDTRAEGDTNKIVLKCSEQKEKSENKSLELVSASENSESEPEKLIDSLFRDGKSAFLVGDCFTAADILGKCCEEARKMYDELDVKNVEYYYYYGCAMLDCARNENTVLGEKIKQKDLDNEEDDEEEEEEVEEDVKDETVDKEVNTEENGSGSNVETESMVTDEKLEEVSEISHDADPSKIVNGDEEEALNGDEGEPVNGDAEHGEEEEDTSLKVAWEMLELSKVIYQRSGNDKELADTYMKLGEVGIESGHSTAMSDMLIALDIRQKLHSENSRIVAETSFHIGLAYASFQLFDEAIQYFEKAKNILNVKLGSLSDLDTKEAEEEVKEIKELIPDLDEKIQDMKESKEEQLKKAELEKQNGEGSATGISGTSSDKPVSNIGHLVKRKRKLDDVTSELLPSTKQPCTEKVSEIVSTPDSVN